MDEIALEEFYKLLNKLIKSKKIRFNYYNTKKNAELLQCLFNKRDETIELSFRDIMTERIEELREITDEYKRLKEKN